MTSSTSHHRLVSNLPPRSSTVFISTAAKTPNPLPLPASTRRHFPLSTTLTLPLTSRRLEAYTSASSSAGPPYSDDEFASFNLDYFLSIAELLCLASSAAVTIGLGLNAAFVKGRVLGGGAAALVAAAGIGAWIRRRQWRRVSRGTVKGGVEVNLYERIEKLEEDLRSSARVVRVLSRQLEKLGIRFRITRKALKEPIAETAALAQKNSEATRALAAQEDILEKELGETQKVLLAMQEQQQKQLELILAIAKNGKLLDNKQVPEQPESTVRIRDSSKDNSKQKEPQQI